MTNDSFSQRVSNAQDIPLEQQLHAGAPITGTMDPKLEKFLHDLIKLIDEKQIDPYAPDSFLNKDVYDQLDEKWQGKVDLALVNMVDLVRKIEEYVRSKQTPDECPQYENMVASLLQMKDRLEEHHDVFKF